MNRITLSILEKKAKELSTEQIKRCAIKYYENKEYDLAIVYFNEGATRADGECQYYYARMLQFGWGIEKPNTKESIYWYLKAAENKDKNALYTLGTFFETGMMHCEKDRKRSELYYLEAAELGHKKARETLIIRFEQCLLPLTFAEEEMIGFYIELAAEGDQEATVFLGLCKLIGLYIEQNQSFAFEVFLKEAQENNAAAAYFAAFCYHHGIGVGQDMKQATYWYKKAAENDDKDARRTLAHLTGEYADEVEDFRYIVISEPNIEERKGRKAVWSLIKCPEFYRFAADYDDANACYLYAFSAELRRKIENHTYDPTTYYEKAKRLSRCL